MVWPTHAFQYHNVFVQERICTSPPPEEFISPASLFTTSLPRATSATLNPFLANKRLLLM